jgi:hypothetical protein
LARAHAGPAYCAFARRRCARTVWDARGRCHHRRGQRQTQRRAASRNRGCRGHGSHRLRCCRHGRRGHLHVARRCHRTMRWSSSSIPTAAGRARFVGEGSSAQPRVANRTQLERAGDRVRQRRVGRRGPRIPARYTDASRPAALRCRLPVGPPGRSALSGGGCECLHVDERARPDRLLHRRLWLPNDQRWADPPSRPQMTDAEPAIRTRGRRVTTLP